MRTVIATLALSGAVIAAGATDHASLKSLGDRRACERQESGRVVYAGPSEALDACLERLDQRGPIAELRITSAGGSAWETLDLARRYTGRIDRLVVDGLCASSCANYLVPAARGVDVMADSYVLLHGSPNLRDLDPQIPDTRAKLMVSMRAENPGKPEADIAATVDAALQAMRDEVIAKIPEQEAWAAGVLACEDWLHPQRHLKEPLPPGTAWLMVTPQMARRCLKSTQVGEFWAPAAGAELPRGAGLLRARH